MFAGGCTRQGEGYWVRHPGNMHRNTYRTAGTAGALLADQ